MHRESPETLHLDLVHGHSRIIWLLDEFEAHLRALHSEPTGAPYILEELEKYWDELRDHLREHIVEEEEELFPMVRLTATDFERRELVELQREHAELVRKLSGVEATVHRLFTAAEADRCPLVKSLAEQAGALREELVEHSRHERAFLRTIKSKLSASCLHM